MYNESACDLCTRQIFVCMCIYRDVRFMCRCVYIYTHTYMCVCLSVCVTYMCRCVYIYTHTHTIHADVCIYMCRCVYIYTHTYVCACVSVCVSHTCSDMCIYIQLECEPYTLTAGLGKKNQLNAKLPL